MRHWVASSVLGLLICGTYRPLCAIVYATPDCLGRRVFLAAMDRAFGEGDHCRKIWTIWAVSDALRKRG